MPGVRDYSRMFARYKVGELSGHSFPYSFKFQTANDGYSER